ncbi:Aldo/keto reductase [Paramyrothecium foliicola]|nr:Aldo/keto reductase [Paramyrothecium foliicola]
MAPEFPQSLKESLANSKCEYRQLGSSGLRISVPIFGCMSIGDPEWAPWNIGSLPLLKAAYDKGLNTWDTANSYSNGVSETIIAKTLEKYSIPREKVVIMTKCFWASAEDIKTTHWYMRNGVEPNKEFQNQYGLSRAAIFNQVEASLKRLNTTYIDLLQIHRFDTTTPIEETMKALHDLVESGKVRYIGANSMLATRFARMQACAERNGWTKFVSMQPRYSLLYREEEREMLQYCKETGVGVIPWAPLAGGFLARPPSAAGSTVRSEGNTLEGADLEIANRVVEIAEKRGWPMAHVALAWVKKRVSSPIIGFSSVERIDQAISVRGKELTEEEDSYLTEPYKPKEYYVPEILGE